MTFTAHQVQSFLAWGGGGLPEVRRSGLTITTTMPNGDDKGGHGGGWTVGDRCNGGGG